jgi:uncharacterized protein (TIGR00266 family)
LEWKVIASPAYSLLRIDLKPGEAVDCEAGSMMAFSGELDIRTHTGGGLLKALVRRIAATEAVFLNTFTARSEAELLLAPTLPGDIKYLPLDGKSYIVQDASYLAHHGDVALDVAWRGLRGLLTEGELVWLRVSGRGGVWINSYGAMLEYELKPGERMTVDNFHFVAMDEGARWRVTKFGGWKSTILGGEGLVAEVEGPAHLILQTRTMPPFAQYLRKFFRTR